MMILSDIPSNGAFNLNLFTNHSRYNKTLCTIFPQGGGNHIPP